MAETERKSIYQRQNSVALINRYNLDDRLKFLPNLSPAIMQTYNETFCCTKTSLDNSDLHKYI